MPKPLLGYNKCKRDPVDVELEMSLLGWVTSGILADPPRDFAYENGQSILQVR